MRFGLYAGGFLGPFGGAILAVLIPELREAFDGHLARLGLQVRGQRLRGAAGKKR